MSFADVIIAILIVACIWRGIFYWRLRGLTQKQFLVTSLPFFLDAIILMIWLGTVIVGSTLFPQLSEENLVQSSLLIISVLVLIQGFLFVLFAHDKAGALIMAKNAPSAAWRSWMKPKTSDREKITKVYRVGGVLLMGAAVLLMTVCILLLKDQI